MLPREAWRRDPEARDFSSWDAKKEVRAGETPAPTRGTRALPRISAETGDATTLLPRVNFGTGLRELRRPLFQPLFDCYGFVGSLFRSKFPNVLCDFRAAEVGTTHEWGSDE